MAMRVARTRPALVLSERFVIDFRMTVSAPGITKETAEAFVQEAVRYYIGARLGKIHGDVRVKEYYVDKINAS